MPKIDDLEKIKMDILRDAVKDASDTIRALDRKIVFLVSYNALFLGLIGTILAKKDTLAISSPSVTILSIFAFFWVCVLIGIMMNISPVQNPSDVFYSKEDKKFGFNMFFILMKKDEHHSLEYLLNNFDKEITDERSAKKLLFKEIAKVSFIRDNKIRNIQLSVNLSYVFTFIFMLMFLYETLDKSTI